MLTSRTLNHESYMGFLFKEQRTNMIKCPIVFRVLETHLVSLKSILKSKLRFASLAFSSSSFLFSPSLSFAFYCLTYTFLWQCYDLVVSCMCLQQMVKISLLFAANGMFAATTLIASFRILFSFPRDFYIFDIYRVT